jgi:hypothetical protein
MQHAAYLHLSTSPFFSPDWASCGLAGVRPPEHRSPGDRFGHFCRGCQQNALVSSEALARCSGMALLLYIPTLAVANTLAVDHNKINRVWVVGLY